MFFRVFRVGILRIVCGIIVGLGRIGLGWGLGLGVVAVLTVCVWLRLVTIRIFSSLSVSRITIG